MSFRRALGPFDATMVVIGGIIGAGIFINPYIVARRLDSAGWVLAAWVAGGIIALAGALTFAELGSLFPRAGGHYAYLRRGYHPLAGFLYGWALLLIIETGAMAAVAITFAEYTLRLVGLAGMPAVPLAVAAILVVSLINYLGVVPGSRVLNVFVVLKVAALALLIGAGFLVSAVRAPVSAPLSATVGAGRPGSFLLVAFGAALIPIMFSYGGWQNANYVAEEIRDPRRNLPRSLIMGTIVVVLVYVLVNAVYLRALGRDGLAATLTPAADAARGLFGPAGDGLVTLAIAISTFGFLDLAVLAPTRVYYAMAADGVFLPAMSRLHPRFNTPTRAIVVQSAWAIALTLTGTYAQLVDSVVFADWIFFGLTVGSVFIFRRRFPIEERVPGHFAVPWYPWVPALFMAAAILIVGSSIWANPVRSLVGMALLASGVPVFAYWNGRGGGEGEGAGEGEVGVAVRPGAGA